MPVAIYGQFDNHWSVAGVSRGLYAGLEALGFKPFCATDVAPSAMWLYVHGTSNPSWYEPDALDVEWGAADPAWPAIYIGYPPLAPEPFWRHRVKIGLFITESRRIPPEWGQLAARCDLVIPPSHWARDVYQLAGVPREKLLVVHHGIHPVFSLGLDPGVRSMRPACPRLLHIAGARDFIDRKGTPQLIEAYKDFARVRDVQLVIRTPWSPRIQAAVETASLGEALVMDYHETALAPERVREYYDGVDAVVQPSMGEAFGIVPVEARAAGLHVILTGTSGHAEHLTAWDTLVPSSGQREMATNGIPNGSVYDVSVLDIRYALNRWWYRRDELRQDAIDAASRYAAAWRWDLVLNRARLRDALREV